MFGENMIDIKVIGGTWHAIYKGPHSSKIKSLFGTDTIPTAFTAQTPAKVVVNILVHKNMGVAVGISL